MGTFEALDSVVVGICVVDSVIIFDLFVNLVGFLNDLRWRFLVGVLNEDFLSCYGIDSEIALQFIVDSVGLLVLVVHQVEIKSDFFQFFLLALLIGLFEFPNP